MGRVVFLNKKGFTLVEVMISLVIALIVFLAMMQLGIVGIDSNMKNILRDEAANIAERKISDTRNVPFDSIASGTTSETVTRTFRNMASYPYTVSQTVSNLGLDDRQVVITVTWEWKDNTVANGNPYTHTITSIVRRP